VVDRAEPGARGDQHRKAERDREVAHGVGVGERDQQAADALGDQHVGAVGLRAGGREQRVDVDRRPCLRGREVRRDGRAEACRAHRFGRAAGRAGQQRVVVRPAEGRGLVQARHDRFERRHPRAPARQRGDHRPGDHRLAGPGVRFR